MADHKSFDEFDELDDLEFERLFASLDDVRASDALKASTLDAILAQADETSGTDAQKATERGFVLIEGAARAEEARRDATGEDVSAATPVDVSLASDVTTDHAGSVPRKRARAARNRGAFMLRVAAALLVAVLIVGGTTAFALPSSHVYVTAGETTFDLGVNMFGITVSAEADSDDGKEILDDADVRNERFEEAFDRILAAYEERGGEDEPTVRVESSAPFGGGERLDEEARDVMDAHEQSRDEQKTRDDQDAADDKAAPSAVDQGASGVGGAEGRQDGGQAPSGNAPQAEPASPEASEGNAEPRVPESTAGPAGEARPKDGGTEMDGGGLPPN